MKFVVEGRGLTVGGGKVGVLQILPAMARQGRHEYVAYLPDIPEYAELDSPNLRVVLTPIASNLLVREWWLNARLRKICHDEKADGLLCLGNFAPHYPPVPTVIRLQNAFYIYQDASACRGLTLRERLIVKYGREHYRHLADSVCVVVQTQAMKRQLLLQSQISAANVVVIPDRGMRFPASSDRGANTRKGAPSPFTFLCVALYSPNKNLEVLVDAVKKVRTLTSRPFRCMLTIDPHQHPAARKLLARIECEAVESHLVNAGSLPPEQLAATYGSADAFILPTLLESFGRPYDEAMNFELPILTSDRDFARERCRDAAIYFDPLDADSVARAMARVMEDVALRQRLVENGRRVLADSPSWDDIAARFVEVLERTARGEPPVPTEPHARHAERSFGVRQLAAAFPFASSPAGISAVSVLPSQQAGSNQSGSELPHSNASPALVNCAGRRLVTARKKESTLGVDDVRTLFNQKARSWRSKYGSTGKLKSRVEQFAERVAGLCPPPAGILDFGCGTGDIAAAIDAMGYQVTACDFAEEMIAVARSNYSDTAVKWICLEPDWRILPFADQSFAGIVASSVFEYVDNVPQVAQELSRVLRPDGILLLTVPNPYHVVRKLEARVQSSPLVDRLSPLLRTVQRFDSYASYLRLSKNRFAAQGWKSILGAAHFAPLDEGEFSDDAWQQQVNAPLILLGVKRTATPLQRQIDVEPALCRHVAG